MNDIGKYISVDTASLINQVFDNPGTAMLRIPFTTMLRLLGAVAQRAIELDDAELNTLMIRLNLYEIPPTERSQRLDEQFARIKEPKCKKYL